MYAHNLGGAKSKIYKINDALATTHFDIILIQESWFDDSVDSSEIIASSHFKIERSDRSNFMNRKKIGGGIATIVKNTINYTRIPVFEKTNFEFNVIRIKLGHAFHILMNAYFPPNGPRKLES